MNQKRFKIHHQLQHGSYFDPDLNKETRERKEGLKKRERMNKLGECKKII